MPLAKPRAERKPWIAGVLNILLPGFGHVYLGSTKQGVYWFVTFQLLALASVLIARSPLLPTGLNLAGILVPLIGYIFLVRSAMRVARRRQQAGLPESLPSKHFSLAVFVIGGCLAWFMPDLMRGIVKAHKIPAESMAPTVLADDYIYVDTLISHFKFKPRRGEIITFLYPKDEGKSFLKRVIGLPGDRIEIRNKIVFVNGVPLDDGSYTQRLDPRVVPGHEHPRDNFGPVILPEQFYFVLGDNRDASLDSRFWGYVHESKITGRARLIYWSVNKQGAWSEWVRWERIGKRIQ
ncbi:MAG TPA: signal peptidase I [Nitrospira sp.]|jgi:signal peptidase I|nr:signal peptidase I [Nitrospira sp.]